MIRFASAALIAACLLMLPACRQSALTPMLDIQDLNTEDNTISVSFAIDKVGWLVLHPATAEGEPDTSEVLKKSPLAVAGTYSDDMTMPDATSTDSTFFLVLYYDDPADKKFTFTPGNDADPPVEVDGETVQGSFTVPGVPPYIEMTQNVSDDTITINGITYQAGLLLVLCPATPEGEPDTSTTIKIYELPYANEFTITITMPGTLDEGDTLFAMLHYDNPNDDLFTYVPDGDEDLPVKFNDIAIVDSLEIQ